jgi:hypothetical protein
MSGVVPGGAGVGDGGDGDGGDGGGGDGGGVPGGAGGGGDCGTLQPLEKIAWPCESQFLPGYVCGFPLLST